MKVDVKDLDCDFYVFSAHKLGGPTGIGALYGKEELLSDTDPYHLGGGMNKKIENAKKALYASTNIRASFIMLFFTIFAKKIGILFFTHYTVCILARACIDTNPIAFVYEDRYW
mgnify:CR=1 FL=1